MKLLRNLLSTAIWLLFFPLLAQNPEYAAREKSLCRYTSLVIDAPVNIEIDASAPSTGTLVASKDDLNKVSWEVKEGTLVIAVKPGQTLVGSVHLTLGGDAIAHIESTTESIIYLHHFNGKRLDLDILKGSLKMEGSVSHLRAMTEKGRIYGSGLRSETAEVMVWDEGTAVINASQVLEAEAAGGGRVIYSGRPAEVRKRTGSGGFIMSEQELNQPREVEYVNFGV